MAQRICFALLLLLSWPAVLPAEDEANAIHAFVNVNVVPMDREVVLEGRTVIIRGGKIEAVGPGDPR